MLDPVVQSALVVLVAYLLDPVVQSALVVLVAYLLDLSAKALGIPLSTEVLASLAAAIVAWLLGVPAGSAVAQGIRRIRS